jgi:hypothetical protein
MKMCKSCHTTKDANGFYKQGAGLSSLCRVCYCLRYKPKYKPEYYKNWYIKNQERVKEYRRGHYRAHKEAYIKRADIYQKTEKYILWKRKYRQEYRKKTAKKTKAREIAQRFFRVNIRPPCQLCHQPKTEFHHIDYAKPLTGHHLCAGCHRKIHNTPGLLEGVVIFDYTAEHKDQKPNALGIA